MADQPTAPGPLPPRTAIAIAPVKVRAPYDVQVLRESGETLPTYGMKDRYYVQGNIGERYIIKVTNPTANRVEAVVTVDGLDVIDGEAGDLRKRGYVIPAYGETQVEGFRTSTDDVATFRFSTVDGSYSGQKGKARNVGVIAVALFEEQHEAPQQIIVEDITKSPNRPYDYREDLDSRADAPAKDAKKRVANVDKEESGGRGADESVRRQSPPPPPAQAPPSPTASRPAPDAPAHGKSANYDGDDAGEGYYQPAPPQQQQHRTERPGLGTEFGEQRYSAAIYTRFVRAPGAPDAVSELRYNDSAGLTALGINVQPLPDEGEIMTRETADPFPGDEHFARPVR